MEYIFIMPFLQGTQGMYIVLPSTILFSQQVGKYVRLESFMAE